MPISRRLRRPSPATKQRWRCCPNRSANRPSPSKMTSESHHDEAYVWIWLPGRTTPVVAGVLARADDQLVFNYGRSYLARKDAIAIYDTELPLNADLDQALFHGSSLGGARPKALIAANDRKYIAKFSSRSDEYSVVKAEYIAMRLADVVGISVAPVRLVVAAGKDVLLIERFDRVRTDRGWRRKAMVSALTLFGLDELMARYASYEDLATIIRHRFQAPAETLRELFGRLVFNILCGNTDDHARNHAAFWDGRSLSLTPAYDICPQQRAGNEATQAMLIIGDQRFSQLAVCLKAAPMFLLSAERAVG